MKPPLDYTPRQGVIWERTHMYLSKEFPDAYDTLQHEGFVHKCVCDHVGTPWFLGSQDRVPPKGGQ